MQSTLYCPKCSGDMVPLRRSGVLIERCSDCSGVFLDRGELEKIIAMEQQAERSWDDNDSDGDVEYDERGTGRRPRSRKRRFFEELLDID